MSSTKVGAKNEKTNIRLKNNYCKYNYYKYNNYIYNKKVANNDYFFDIVMGMC